MTTPSTNRRRLARPVRSASPCSAVGRWLPRGRRPGTRRSSPASSPCESRQTRSSAPTAPSPAPTARASSSATVGNSVSIRASRRAAPPGQQVVGAGHPHAQPDDGEQQDGSTTPASRSTSGEHYRRRPRRPQPRAPQSTCSARNRSTSAASPARQQPAAHRAGPAHDALDRPAPRSRTTGPATTPRAPAAGRTVVEQPGRRRGVAQVGQRAGRPAPARRCRGRPSQTSASPSAEHEAEQPHRRRASAAHRSTRSSSGSRPIRSITR